MLGETPDDVTRQDLLLLTFALVGPHGLVASLHRFTFDMSMAPGRSFLVESVVVGWMVVVGGCGCGGGCNHNCECNRAVWDINHNTVVTDRRCGCSGVDVNAWDM